MIGTIANILFIILFPLFFTGCINRTKSFWGGRQGPSLFQPYRDFVKLLKKGAVISRTTSFIFAMAPSVTAASVVSAALFVPLLGKTSFMSFDIDFVLFAYMLAAGKFFTIIGAMDTGSSFEGMGASREAAFSALVEPGFFIILGSLAFIVNASSFSEIMNLSSVSPDLRIIITVLSSIALFIMLLAEGCRVPVDDPNTHLELTMIHEVMVLDNSGPDLAFIMYASALKMVLIGSLIANIIIPADLHPLISAAAFISIHLTIAALIGTIESLLARLRMTHIPQFILYMNSIAMVISAVIVLYVSGGLR